MNMSVKAAVVAIALGVGSVSASEIIVTPMATGEGKISLAFDIVSDGGIGAFNFKVNVPGLKDKAGSLGSCVAELPTGFQGECSVTKEGIYVYAVSNNPNVSLSRGVVPVGRVELTYPGARAKLGGALVPTVSEVALFDNQAKALPVTSRVELDVARANENNARQKQK